MFFLISFIMTTNMIKCITQTANYLKVCPGKMQIYSNSVPVRVINDVATEGFVAIVLELLKETKSKLNELDLTEVRQWLEYAIVYVAIAEGSHNIELILKELNDLLSTRTYLISHRISIGDVVLFYILHHIMANLSYLDKEKYIHLSRWFDNLQQDPLIRQKNAVITFKTNYLIVRAPVKQ